MKFWVCLLLLIFCKGHSYAQPAFQEIKGLSTKEVYDLLVDKRGYLWVGHELGISRYNGSGFTHFSNPQQASLSMTDLLEDKQGRIWCHNFSGQIFYIQHEQMYWLKEYDYTKEQQFPRMALCGDELVITSSQGLFICNTATMQCKYINVAEGMVGGIRSISVIGNKVIAYNDFKWYCYEAKLGLHLINEEWKQERLYSNSYTLQPYSFNDTIFLTANPLGILYKYIYAGNRMILVNTKLLHGFINAVTVDNHKAWVHTKTKSIMLDAESEVDNNNLTDVVTDHQGNSWFSSLKLGLLVRYNPPPWHYIEMQDVGKNDFVRCLNTDNGLLLGTQNGKLLFEDKKTKKIIWETQLEEGSGAIEFIKPYKPNHYLVSTSSNVKLVNTSLKTVKPIPPFVNIIDADFNRSAMYLASPVGLFTLRPIDTTVDKWQWYSTLHHQFPSLSLYNKDGEFQLSLRQRCKSVRYEIASNTLAVAFKDGLYEINKKGMYPILYQNKQVYATSLEYIGNRLIIGTTNNGLLIKNGKAIKTISTNEGLASNHILKVKVLGSHLWVFESNGIQLIDLNKDAVVDYILLPTIAGSTAYDIVEINSEAYLTTVDGIVKIPIIKNFIKTNFKSFLNYALINITDTAFNSDISLPYNKNDIEFNVSIPWYNPNQSVLFKYRLSNGTQIREWLTTDGPQSSVRFLSLMPGNYIFECYALVNGVQEKEGIKFTFIIQKPWWLQWWFFTILICLVLLLSYLFNYFRLKQLLKIETIRRTISSDLHDDIGATLSSVNIYAELAKKGTDGKEYINLIQENTRDIITKLDDLVWSINPKNDTFEQLINRMKLFAEPLLAGANIHSTFKCDTDLYKLKLTIDKKRNLYLIFKELINNVVKHSKSNNCLITVLQTGSHIFLEVKDDGVGLDAAIKKHDRNGLKNIFERSKQMNSKIKINSTEEGTGIGITIPI